MSEEKPREPWWVWHWDYQHVPGAPLPYTSIKRWRRGSLLTVYRMESSGDVQWWFYGPFNLGIGFSHPK